jgi:hypothetical protein
MGGKKKRKRKNRQTLVSQDIHVRMYVCVCVYVRVYVCTPRVVTNQLYSTQVITLKLMFPSSFFFFKG